ncbi:molybdenum cofactor sulfurtransferase [Microdochium nivale]|nr:molybdenum cofactor sulfurtransferase [Microdochium nivale]
MADERSAYNSRIEKLRATEFPMLQGDVYLDHAGTTLHPKSLLDSFVSDITTNLYGNPHSASTSSQRATASIDDIRHATLQFFGADPAEYDLVFVANATAGVKLVTEAFRALPGGFHYLYHQDSHTSLVGIRQEAQTSRCLADRDVDSWLAASMPHHGDDSLSTLFAYPAQSNMDGRKLPLGWSAKARQPPLTEGTRVYTLLDAAALVATSPLDLGDSDSAPDFVVVSFNKIFGLPSLGGLIVRRQASSCFRYRRYFGGGTVDMVVSVGETWHNIKRRTLHEALEDGTLPIHSIVALGHALRIHPRLYGSMQQVSEHTRFLRRRLAERLGSLCHAGSGAAVCTIYSPDQPGDIDDAGPTIAFNLQDETGAWVSTAEFEKLAILKHFHVRTGGLCNPGGVAAALQLEPWEMRQNFSAGFRCDNGNDIMNGKPTGVVRISLGAMSTISDVDRFADFVQEFYVTTSAASTGSTPSTSKAMADMYIDQLVVYPIKSCGGFRVSKDTSWEVRAEGLAWDREWCLVHLGTGQALSQKRYPRMALIKPSLDLERGEMHVTYTAPTNPCDARELTISLSADPTIYKRIRADCTVSSRVCGEDVVAQTYASVEISNFFSDILGTPCALARFPAGGLGKSMRHAKAHLQKHQRPAAVTGDQLVKPPHVRDGSGVVTPPDSDTEAEKPRILLSNESPILAISLASLDALNSEIMGSGRGGLPVSAEVFRANVVIGSRGRGRSHQGVDQDGDGEESSTASKTLQPYDEDHWSTLAIGSQTFRMMGSCRRCHMVCINQDTGQKSEEPFITLTKTRKFDGKVFFGTHMCWTPRRAEADGTSAAQPLATIRVGEKVVVES